jgi:hypothetical protein
MRRYTSVIAIAFFCSLTVSFGGFNLQKLNPISLAGGGLAGLASPTIARTANAFGQQGGQLLAQLNADATGQLNRINEILIDRLNQIDDKAKELLKHVDNLLASADAMGDSRGLLLKDR